MLPLALAYHSTRDRRAQDLAPLFHAGLTRAHRFLIRFSFSIDFHEHSSLYAEELIDAINSMDGTYAIATVNPDGTPNIAFVPFGCSFVQDQLYLQMNFTSYSQTHINLARTGEAYALFAVHGAVDAEKSAPVYSMTGAHEAIPGA